MATTKSTKPSAKPTTNKLSVAGTSGLSRRKRIALVAVLVGVLGVGSSWGYYSYQAKQVKAHAAATYIGSSGPSGDIKVSACKISVPNSIYGPLWKINAYFDKTASKDKNSPGLGSSILVSRNPGPSGAATVAFVTNFTWAYGGYSGLTAYASQILNDRVIFQVTRGNTNYGIGQAKPSMWDAWGIFPARLPNC